MSLLTIVQDAMELCGLRSPSSVISNTDPTVARFRVLSQVEGDETARAHDWRGLKVLFTVTGDGTTTDFALPSDFQRFMQGDKFWMDATPTRPLMKVTDDEMARAKANDVDPIYPYWRLFGDNVEFYPAPETGQIIRSEYRTDQWIYNDVAAASKLRWTDDADYARLPERVLTLGVVWRWRKAQGLDYAEDFRTWQIAKADEAFADNPRQTIRINKPLAHDGLLRGLYGDTPAITP